MENLESLDQLDSLLDDYENSIKNDGKDFGLDKEEKKKKKFKITSSDETFRFIKNSKGKYYEEAFFHEVKVGKYNQKVYCLKNDGHDCPLCNKADALLLKQHKGKYSELTEDQKEHNKKYYKAHMAYAAKKHFVFEGVDRGVEKDGKKIWLAKENKKKEGILDKLIPAIKSYKTTHQKDYTDINEGVDMTISSVQDVIQTTKAKYWKVVSITPNGKPTPLHNDENTLNKYLNDKTTWRDVYPPYEITDVVDKFEMIKLISEGNTPYWDEDKKTFVFPNRPDLQKLFEDKRSETKTKEKQTDADDTDQIANMLNSDDEDDDLENDLNNIRNNANDHDIANIDDDFDDLPF
jgi:hypothetical protein